MAFGLLFDRTNHCLDKRHPVGSDVLVNAENREVVKTIEIMKMTIFPNKTKYKIKEVYYVE